MNETPRHPMDVIREEAKAYRGTWKIDPNGGFANFTEGESYDTAAMDSLGDIQPRPNGPDARASKKPPSRVTGAGTFMRSYEAISYTIDGVLPSGCLYGLTAKPGTGKTAGMIAATLAVETRREDILGCAVERGRVAYVTIENPVDFKMKLTVNCYFHNISFDQIEPRVAIIDGRDTPEQIYEGLRLDAEAHGDFQLVNFDTFQAGFAVANAGAFNDNEAVLKYVQRLRPLTGLPGLPSVLVAFHPTKNALETELIPYGGGATYGEIDGNLTLWKEASIKFHWNRVRGPEFEPRFFRTEKLSCPDILDKQGRQILLPVMRPSTEWTPRNARKAREISTSHCSGQWQPIRTEHKPNGHSRSASARKEASAENCKNSKP
jgi:hypothetical protein